MTPAEARAALHGRRRELRRYHAQEPPPDEELDSCPVCPHAVFSDHTSRMTRAGSRWAPVDMPDGGVTHVGCKSAYWQAVDEHARVHSYVPSLADLLDADDDRDVGVLAQSAHERYLTDHSGRLT